MKGILLLVCIVIGYHSMAASDITVTCIRSLDGKLLTADSIRVECPDLHVRYTTKDSVLVLPNTTSVFSSGDLLVPTGPADLYDVRGRLVAHVDKLSAYGMQWHRDYGFVYVVSTSVPKHRRDKTDGTVMGTLMVTLTAWRDGYAPTTVILPVPATDTNVSVVMDLLPWWHRIHTVVLTASAPLVRYYSSSNGGRDTTSRSYSFGAWSGIASKPEPAMPTSWTTTDSSFEYFYDFNDHGLPYGITTRGMLMMDTVRNKVEWLSVSNGSYEPTGGRSSGIIVHHLPEWDTVTTGKLVLFMTDSIANRCLYHATYSSRYNWTDTRPFTSESIVVGPHVPSEKGISVRCVIVLKE